MLFRKDTLFFLQQIYCLCKARKPNLKLINKCCIPVLVFSAAKAPLYIHVGNEQHAGQKKKVSNHRSSIK